MAEDLIALRDIISRAVDSIVAISKARGEPFPSLNDPLNPAVEFSPAGIRNDPKVLDAAGLIIAAANQLIYTVRPPPETLTIDAMRWGLPATLGVANEGNVAEIIRAAGPKGMHVNDIAAKNGMHPKKLGRVLRYLATNHWFREVAPDVFAHNLLSSMLDTGKNLEDITGDKKITKHDNTPGLSAIVGLGADEGAKGGAFLVEMLTDPSTAHSESAQDASAGRALGHRLALFDFYESPGQAARFRRFGVVMAGSSKLQPPAAIITGFDWDSVEQGGVLVDVGGGLGHVALEVARTRPDMKIIIEDRPAVLDGSKAFWQENQPEHLSSGKVQFLGHDFFTAQPPDVSNAHIFLLRMITHDWSDELVIVLLKHLRAAAGKHTKLLIIDALMPYASPVPADSAFARIAGVQNTTPPSPLLPNLGAASQLSYSTDLLMLTQLNAAERTIGGFVEVLEAGGWKLERVQRNIANAAWWPTIVGVPA